MSKTLTVTISPNGGEMKVEVDGVVGPSCTELTKAFESLGTLSHREEKAEFYLQEDQIPVSMEGK